MSRGMVVRIAGLILVMAAALGIASSEPAAGARSEVGSLTLSAALTFSGSPATCPPQAIGANECFQVAGNSVVPGLGRVSESFVVTLVNNAPGCSNTSSYRVLGFPIRLNVAGKGAIDLAVADSAECLTVQGVQRLSRPFTVTGGTGPYATATGGGMFVRNFIGAQGTDTWTGTLVVPRPRVQPHGTDDPWRSVEDGPRTQGSKTSARDLCGGRRGRPQRTRPGLVHAEIRRAFQDRPHEGQLLCDRRGWQQADSDVRRPRAQDQVRLSPSRGKARRRA